MNIYERFMNEGNELFSFNIQAMLDRFPANLMFINIKQVIFLPRGCPTYQLYKKAIYSCMQAKFK